LEQVVEFYKRGGNANPHLSKEIKPLQLTAQDVDDLVAFMEALTGEVNNAQPPAKLPE
jgi:cytochrome c peroxidase